MQQSSRATISVAAVACLLFGLASIALAIPFVLKQYSVVRDWPSTMASVRASEVLETTVSGTKMWVTRFELSYEVGDKIQLTTVNAYRRGNDYEIVKDAAARFPAGSQALIRYNPGNPAEVRLDTDHPRRYYQLPIALGVTGAVFAAFAFVLFFVARN